VTPAPVVLSAVPTLFSPDGELDPDANRALYKLVAGLLDGLFVAGTTGEFPALEDAERLSLFELALAEAGPDRVIAHIGAPDARHAARLARAAAGLGAVRIAAITPYYLPARPDELVAHYRRIRDAAPGPELYAYIFPERTGLHVPPSLFAEVADAVGLAGAKTSGSAAADLAGYVAAVSDLPGPSAAVSDLPGPSAAVSDLPGPSAAVSDLPGPSAAAPGLRIFSGNDADPWATMRAGGAGVISGRSSAYPELYAALCRDPAEQERLDRVVALGASIGRLKHALQFRGLVSGFSPAARMTVDPPDAETAAAIETHVTTLIGSLPNRG
jgi:4-hydroxy-tetrahydrodipicolinate synthase